MRLTIPLSDATGDALRRLASQEHRDTRTQAKFLFLLEQAIRERAGAPPVDDRVTATGSPAMREPA